MKKGLCNKPNRLRGPHGRLDQPVTKVSTQDGLITNSYLGRSWWVVTFWPTAYFAKVNLTLSEPCPLLLCIQDNIP